MSGLGSLSIELSLDSAKFTSSLTKAERQTRQFAEQTKSDFNQMEQCVKRLHSQFDSLSTLGKSIGLGALAKQVVSIADAGTELSNKLKLISEGELQHAQAMSAVYDISLKTAQSTQAVSAVYQSFAQNAKELGINQRQVADITETISKAVAISGASAAEAQNSLTQFGQVLLMGKFRAQEYNSVMTQTPAVMQAIARGLGVTMSELKAMSDEGKLTTDKIIQALEKSKSAIDGLYAKTSTTVSGATQNLSTATQKLVSDLNDAVGGTQKLVNGLDWLAKNLDFVARATLAGGVAYTAFYAKQASARLLANKAKLAAEVSELQATEQTNQAIFRRTAQEANLAKSVLASAQAERNKIAQQIAGNAHLAKLVVTEEGRNRVQAQAVALAQQEKVAIDNLTAAQMRYNASKTAAISAFNSLNQAQSAAKAGAVSLSKSVGLVGTALNGVKAAGSALWGFVAANPLLLVGAIGYGIYEWGRGIEETKQKAIEFADQLESIKQSIQTMDSISLNATKAKLEQSAEAQKENLVKLRKEIAQLKQEIESVPEFRFYVDDSGHTQKISTVKELTKLTQELAIKEKELKDTDEKLSDTNKTLADVMGQLPVSELKEQFSALFPQIEQSQIKVDGLNVSIGNLTVTLPQASVEALKFAGTIGAIATSAIQAAVAVANLNNVSGGQLGETAQKMIRLNQIDGELSSARKTKDAKKIAELQLERDRLNGKFKDLSGNDLQAVEESYLSLYKQQAVEGFQKSTGGAKTKGGKSKKSKGTGADYQKQLTDQLTAMESRLSELRANAEDIALFGQVSQYQEVNRLTQDIKENAEKYSHYSLDGIKKLKSLAASIDSENQKIAISQFRFDNSEKLDAMEFELSLLGKTRQEQELIQYNHQLDLEAAKLKVGMTEENIRKLDEEIAKLKERHAEIQKQAEKARGSWQEGVKQGWANIEADVTNVAANVARITENTFNGMADTLTDFVTTGKADFRSFAQSVIRDITNMMVKMALFNAINPFMSGFMGGAGSIPFGQMFATGGYTGDGGKYQPAGIVHRGEYVITKEATARLGRGYLDYLNYGKRGFANGGGVAVPSVPMNYERSSTNNANSNQVSININIDQHGNTDSTVTAENAKALGQTIEVKVLEVLAKQRRAGGMLS